MEGVDYAVAGDDGLYSYHEESVIEIADEKDRIIAQLEDALRKNNEISDARQASLAKSQRECQSLRDECHKLSTEVNLSRMKEYAEGPLLLRANTQAQTIARLEDALKKSDAENVSLSENIALMSKRIDELMFGNDRTNRVQSEMIVDMKNKLQAISEIVR